MVLLINRLFDCITLYNSIIHAFKKNFVFLTVVIGLLQNKHTKTYKRKTEKGRSYLLQLKLFEYVGMGCLPSCLY